MSTQSTLRTADFINSIGVNTHLAYTDSKYVYVNSAINDFHYLGLNLAREPGLNPTWDQTGQRNIGVAADAGIKFNFIADATVFSKQGLTLYDAFAKAHPGSIAAIEGPNEINNFQVYYNGLKGPSAAIAYQNALYAAVKADPALPGVPVYSFTLEAGATPTGGYDAVSLHPYPRWGTQPYATIQNSLKAAPAGAATVLTEIGVSTASNDSQYGVDQLTQAKETLNAIFDSKALGTQSIYLYELRDAYNDPSGNTAALHFGLFDYYNQPKVAAVALHNLTTILQDTGSAATSFAAGALNYSISDLPSTGHSLLLEKSSGAYDVVVWNEPKIWDSTTHTPIAAAPVTVTVNLGGTHTLVEVFDPLSGSSPVQVLNNVSQVALQVTDHPLIVQVEPEAGASTATMSSFARSPTLTSASGQPAHAASPALPASASGADAHGAATSAVQNLHNLVGVGTMDLGHLNHAFLF